MVVFNVCANDSVQLLYNNIKFLMEELLMNRFIMWLRTTAHSLCYHTRLPNIFFCYEYFCQWKCYFSSFGLYFPHFYFYHLF